MLSFDIAAAQIDGARDYQEDAFLVTYLGERSTQNGSLLIVADGMGGHAAGNVASNMAVQSFNREVVASFPSDDVSGLLRGAVEKANGAIAETVRETAALKGMGCTLVAVLIEGDQIHWVSVGDSHLYLVRDGELTKLNADHSYGGFLDRMAAEGNPVQAEAGFSRNMLMSALTGENIADVDCPETPLELKVGDRLVLASDGLDTLGHEQIVQFCENWRSARESVDDLLGTVEEAGLPKQDNTTVIVLAVSSDGDGESGIGDEPAPGAAVFGSSDVSPAAQMNIPARPTTVPRGIEPDRVSMRYSSRPKSAAAPPPKRKLPTGVVVALVGVLAIGAGAFLLLRPAEVAPPRPIASEVEAVEPVQPVDGTPAAPVFEAVAEVQVQPAPTFRDQGAAGAAPLMAALPDGRFTMGSKPPSVHFDEQPQRNVTIAAFAIGVREVTVAEYAAFARATGRGLPSLGRVDPATTPMTMVSAADAVAYTRWLSQVTRAPYRLPSEAEWEYAMRAGTTSTYYWGRELTEGNAHCVACENPLDPRQPAPVGSFPPNAFGLFDMAGNVQEWTADCYRDSYADAPTDGSAVRPPEGACVAQVVRGGAFISGPRALRSAAREKLAPDEANDFTGFRVARDLAE